MTRRATHLLTLCSLAILGACAGRTPAPATAPEPTTALRTDAKYVVIDVDENVLRFMQGQRVLWEAPVGTGTGFRLQTSQKGWEFSTPSGMFQVQYKEQNPTWEIPDWYYIENKLPIPPANSPRRKQPGGLGAAAVFLGQEIAIHGTDKPELLGKRVSHGCIRLSNTNALRLFHNVQLGTPVIIKGGSSVVIREMPDSAASFTRPRTGGRTRPYVNPFAKAQTSALLQRLNRELARPDTVWTLVASELIGRGLREDVAALRGVLNLAATPADSARRAEYATYLADLFSRGSLRTVVSLNRIEEAPRERAATAIVEATMALYHGPLDAPLAPWPTRRLPKGRLGPEGQKGWLALGEAEERYRERMRGGAKTAAR